MKRIQIISLLLAFAGFALAQQATLTAPVTRTAEDNYKVAELNIRSGAGGQSPQVLMTVSVQDSGGNEIRRFNLVVPDSNHAGATVAGFVSALVTVRATENLHRPPQGQLQGARLLLRPRLSLRRHPRPVKEYRCNGLP